jgi:hypothetical protein
MSNPMMRRGFTVGIARVAAGLLSGDTLLAAPLSYKFKCMKCKLISGYGQPVAKKCPNDRQTMVRQN